MYTLGRFSLLLMVEATLLASGCGGGGITTPPASTANEWTWISGSNTLDAGSVYGTQGTASTANVPGGREYAASWSDTSGNLWLFGGYSGYTANYFNDLWKFSTASKEWTWVSGSNTGNAVGVYGTRGTAAATNVPGARLSAVSWIDRSGNLWLFGGEDQPLNDTVGFLNDLWEFSPANNEWTWVGGSSTINAGGVYGTQGIASTANIPGARYGAVSWVDSSGNLWLFGGAMQTAGSLSVFNDLWEFNPASKEWTWVSGSNTDNSYGVYGTEGIASQNNVPKSRVSAISWIDGSGNLWLFGGIGYDTSGSGNLGDLNDLWEFTPANKEWTWVSGSNALNARGVYGTKGTASTTNVPGARDKAVSWTDSSGNLWLFGGTSGQLDSGGIFSDLWEFSPANKEWAWVSGSNTGIAVAVYGTQGTASASNVPGTRWGAVSWTDSSGQMWLFGGDGFGTNSFGTGGAPGDLNDLWRYNP